MNIMERIRTFFKLTLANTFLYDHAKSIYISIKLKRDKRIFMASFPSAQYVNYSKNELAQQRKQGYCSQYGQDFFIWTHYLKNQPKGRFIDIGANKPDINNNSFFLEKQGWKGIAIDPLKRFIKQWKDLRDTKLILGAVSSNEQKEVFVEIFDKQGWEHALSGFKQHLREEDLTIFDHTEYTINAQPLHHYLADDKTADVLLIDVEGAEMSVLKGIDLDLLSPRFILIENDDIIGGSPLIRQYLLSNNYACVARFAATDDLFIKARL